MSHRTPGARPRRVVAVASLATVIILLGACSDESEPGESDQKSSSNDSSPATPEPTTEEKAEPYLDVPDDVELTEPGQALQIGESATVAWEPRQKQIGALDIEILRVEKTSFKKSFRGWKLDETIKKTTPYFVRAKLTNVGDTDLSKRQVPLYIVDTNGTLVQPSRFQTRFAPCPSNPDFPKGFAQGTSEKFCLVYLTPEGTKFRSVSFRPTQKFNPITWNGQPESDKKATKGKQKNKKKSGQKSENEG